MTEPKVGQVWKPISGDTLKREVTAVKRGPDGALLSVTTTLGGGPKSSREYLPQEWAAFVRRARLVDTSAALGSKA